MLFERLAIDAEADTFNLDFHDRLTVITGVGHLEREGLINELVGALGDSRSGVHLEMASDAGNRFAVFRPEGARHRVIAVDTAEDVSATFTTPEGDIDLLSKAGLDVRSAKRTMRIRAEDLHTTSQEDRYLDVLAQVDQGRLWELADKVQDRELRLNDEADATGTAPEDAEIVVRIEQAHQEAEVAREEHERVRSWTLWASFGSIMIAMPIAIAIGFFAAAPFVIGAVAAGAMSLTYYRRLEAAEKAESDALVEAGANTYLAFHLQRVNRLLSSDQGRKRLMSAAEEHRAALEEWRLIAGDIPVHWALEHAREIRREAREQMTTNRVGRVAVTTPAVTAEVVKDISTVLLGRLGELRTIGPGGESFPVILDEPFSDVPEAAKPDLLALVARASAHQQIILLTEDEEIASWARAEAVTGTLALIEPAAAPAEAKRRARPTGRPHVAA